MKFEKQLGQKLAPKIFRILKNVRKYAEILFFRIYSLEFSRCIIMAEYIIFKLKIVAIVDASLVEGFNEYQL